MATDYANWAYDPQFNRIVNRNLEDEIDGFVLRHPDEMFLALAHARTQGGDQATVESLGELFCLMDDLVDFRTAYRGTPLTTCPRATGRRPASGKPTPRRRSRSSASVPCATGGTSPNARVRSPGHSNSRGVTDAQHHPRCVGVRPRRHRHPPPNGGVRNRPGTCVSSAEILDWIAQLDGKTWVSSTDLGDLVALMDDLLGFQSNFCGCGRSRAANPVAILENRFGRGFRKKRPAPSPDPPTA